MQFLSDRAGRIIDAAVTSDADAVLDLIEEVGTAYGHKGMFAVCCALTETIHRMAFPQIQRGDGSLTGDMVTVTTHQEPACRDEAATLWAARFVAAYINGDGPTITSLFFGGLNDRDQTIRNVVSLVGMAGVVVRQKTQALREQDGGPR